MIPSSAATQPTSVEGQIRAFLERYVQADALDASTDIFASGYVDSMFAMQLVLFLETTFGIRVENDDLSLDNFRSLDRMAAFVGRKGGAAQGEA